MRNLLAGTMVALSGILMMGRPPDRPLAPAVLTHMAGITICDGSRAVSFIRTGMTPIEAAAATAHEAVHVQQYQHLGCEIDSIRHYTDGVLALEVPAYHAGWCEAVSMGADPMALKGRYIRLLTETLADNRALERVITALESWRYPCT